MVTVISAAGVKITIYLIMQDYDIALRDKRQNLSFQNTIVKSLSVELYGLQI